MNKKHHIVSIVSVMQWMHLPWWNSERHDSLEEIFSEEALPAFLRSAVKVHLNLVDAMIDAPQNIENVIEENRVLIGGAP